MDSREIRRKTKQFLKEFSVREPDCGELKRAIEGQGFTVVEYSHLLNDGAVGALVEALKLTDEIRRARSFTYADENHRIVFLNEALSDAEKLLVLSHEAGHIFLGHMSSPPMIGRDVQEEHEANEFSHYLLNRGAWERLRAGIRRHRVLAAAAAAALALLLVGGIVFAVAETEKRYYGNYYITESGNRYHRRNCIFVRDKTNVHRMTVEEFESGEYEPCGMCLP